MNLRHLARAAAALGLLLSQAAPAFAAGSTTPPNLTPAASVANGDLMLVWPTASVGPLESLPWSTLKAQLTTDLAASFLQPSQNLADLGNVTTARQNLGLPLGVSGATVCLLSSSCTYSAALNVSVLTGANGVTVKNGSLSGTHAWTFYPVTNGSDTDMDLFESGTGSANRIIFRHGGDLQMQTGQLQTIAGTTAKAPLNVAPGVAPTSPANGDVWTTTQTLNVQLNGGARGIPFLNSSNSFTQQQLFAGGGAGQAAINLLPQTAPSSPNNGDVWCTSSSCFFRANGATQNMQGVASTSGSLTPTLAYTTPGTSSFAYTVQQGNYVCIAGVVSGWARVLFTPTNTGASGDLIWNNAPYSPQVNSNDNNAGLGPPAAFIGNGGGWSSVTAQYTLGATIFGAGLPFINSSGTSPTFITTANSTSGSSKELVWQFNYLTSSGGC